LDLGNDANAIPPGRRGDSGLAENRRAKTAIFANEINLICPVQPLMQKYFASVFPKTMI
jgi:hypothetical protein